MALREDGEIYTLRAFPFFAMDIIKSCSRTFNTSSLRSIYLGRNNWMFPGNNPDKHVSKNNIDKRFQFFWSKTEASKHCDKNPTPHCLRHSFVVHKLNEWILKGEDLSVLFSYLSKFLGHKDPDETFYYYHLVNEAFEIIRTKDKISDSVIPEVRRR